MSILPTHEFVERTIGTLERMDRSFAYDESSDNDWSKKILDAEAFERLKAIHCKLLRMKEIPDPTRGEGYTIPNPLYLDDTIDDRWGSSIVVSDLALLHNLFLQTQQKDFFMGERAETDIKAHFHDVDQYAQGYHDTVLPDEDFPNYGKVYGLALRKFFIDEIVHEFGMQYPETTQRWQEFCEHEDVGSPAPLAPPYGLSPKTWLREVNFVRNCTNPPEVQ